MKLIAHRGNTDGSILEKENRPDYIQNALDDGFDAEIDLWYIHAKLFLGHDGPQYPIKLDWLLNNQNKLWIHCKDLNSLKFILDFDTLNCFWHQNDKFTLTSKNIIWTYPNNPITEKSVIVILDVDYKYREPLNCYGICSDYVSKYSK